MARYVAAVHTRREAAEVFAYLADLRHFTDWDPGVRGVTQVAGDGGGPDSVFDVRVAGIGGDLTLRYRTVEFDPPRVVAIEATSKALRSFDRITVAAADTGSVVTYDAELTLNGVFAPASCLLGPLFRRIGDRAAAGLRRVLAEQPS